MREAPDIPGWKRALGRFPREVRPDLEAVRRQGGMLRPTQAARVAAAFGGGIDALLPRLLPLAACYAVTPVSAFRVGVVVAGAGARPAVYFGANLEIAGGALGFSVHAEQAAVNNAWLHGERRLTRLSVTAPPCGHCRQFLHELNGAAALRLILPGGQPDWTVDRLLPAAFGPADLGVPTRLLGRLPPCRLRVHNPDPLTRMALQAARASYVPYSGAAAGCAIALAGGATIAGRTAENAAYNPTLSAVASALSSAVLRHGPAALERIVGVVLVEGPGRASQASFTEAVLQACAPGAAFALVAAAAG